MCSVVGCDSERRSAQRFKLPEDPERRLEWVMFIANVNKQRFKESTWTAITVCSEHFTSDCLVNLTGSVQLKPSAVPSLCLNSGAEEPVESFECDEPVGNSEFFGQHDQLETDDGNSCSEESRPASMGSKNGPVPSGASCSPDSSLCSQKQQKNVNTDLIKEKAALLKKKGKFPVNEKRLLQLFSRKCPLCGGKLKMHKVTRGVTITLNQLCIQCDYTYQWKSWVDRSDPAAENKLLTGGAEANSKAAPADEASSSLTDVPEVVALIDEESDSMVESNKSSDPGDMDSDEDWKPVEGVVPVKLFHVKPNEESKETFNYSDYYPALTPQYSQLCTDCGRFFDRRRPHICEHKLKPYSCNICGKRCVNEVALNFHSRIHDANYEFRCKYCQVTFKLRVDKYVHEQIHMTQGKPYKCPDCSETFATSKERRTHLEDHRGTVDLKCRFCGIEFFRPLSIQRHLLVHTGEKPYKCSECQRGFNQASHLKSHMRLHTGERPYKCQHCDKCFNHNVSLKSHLQRYHGVTSEPEQKKLIINKSESDTESVQSSGNKRDTDSELDTEEEEEDTDDEMEGMRRPKSKCRSTGRPKGRPKISGSNGQGSNTGTKKSRVKRQIRKKCTSEENEEVLSNGNTSPDSTEEKEERRKKVIKNTTKSIRSNGKNIRKRRGRQKN
ncbi:zinc finger protein 600-like [Melanotaenia boesemani]|uniref:zinc finger protein 600-like n=1 Tax=Melanotaenia boesemani TaxID=1250792 RepID=UPI001C03FC09|nr:zinc finger protein 600-like [Melanotaenia boesemani]